LRITCPEHQPIVAEALLNTVALAGLFVVESHSQIGAVVTSYCALTEAIDNSQRRRPPIVVDADPDLIASARQL
jgi:hypothetical protein